jgi:AraC family transcriptional regulator
MLDDRYPSEFPMPERPLPYDVFQQLASEGVELRASAHFGEGLAAARWYRNETAETSYILPNHHTLSLYASGGDQIRRRYPDRDLWSRGTGSLCLLPEAVTSDWAIAGPIDLFHLYIPRALLDRVVASVIDRDPARISLPERVFFADETIEQAIRLTFLRKDWSEPVDSLALSHAGHMLIAHLIGHYSTAHNGNLAAKGGLPSRLRRRVADYVEANLEAALTISELAEVAGLSEFHFARMFKATTGETPHAFVLRRRIERARNLLAASRLSLAQVALASGFSSQSHFAESFRKRTGLTPSAYRAAARQ